MMSAKLEATGQEKSHKGGVIWPCPAATPHRITAPYKRVEITAYLTVPSAFDPLCAVRNTFRPVRLVGAGRVGSGLAGDPQACYVLQYGSALGNG